MQVSVLVSAVRYYSLLALLLGLFVLPAHGSEGQKDSVLHSLSFPDNRQQVILVRSEFPVTSDRTELMMPAWTPGSYLVRDFAANVDRLSAYASDGSELSLYKVNKDRWLIETGQLERFVVQYEVFTDQLSVRTSWASEDFSLINAASVLMYTDNSRDLPQHLNMVIDDVRGDVFTSLQRTGQSNTFVAADYDELVDSPVAVANAPSYRFTVENQDYVLVNVGENQFWDGQQAALDVQKIVSQTQWFWQVNPLERPYWFLNFIVGAGGGLEHDHSTVLMTGRAQPRTRKGYIKWLGLVAHEFFHVWNVRRMKPVELVPYDYQQEQYTQQLWLAEGFSSYYDNLILSRAGLINPKEYLDLLAAGIHRLESTPGRRMQTVTEASYDAWIRQYQPNANTINSTVSYYTKGAVIGFVLDTWLRKESRGRHDLDEVMRKMYGLFSSQPYSQEAFIQIVADVGGSEAGEFALTLLNSTEELGVDAALEWYGLELVRTKETTTEDTETVQSAGFGAVWDKGKPGLIVKSVLAASAGADAGLMPGDEVLAIGNERLTAKNEANLMSSFRPGEKTTLLVSRRGGIVSLDIELETAIPDKYLIKLRANYKQSNIRRLQSLLGQEIP